MKGDNFVQAFLRVAKDAQEVHATEKIKELQTVLENVMYKNEMLQKEMKLMKQSYEKEIRELRIQNIRYESQNKAIRMKVTMLQDIVKEDSKKSTKFNPNDLAAYRIMNQENQQLKALLKKYITDQPQS